jgi:hypothetical protein
VTAKYANHAKKEADWEFPSRICTNKPNLACPAARRRVAVNKPSQFARTGPGGRRARAVVQTKPNQGELGHLGDRTAAGRAQGKCAKQTQFARRGRGAGRGILYRQTQFAGTNCAKQTQFPPDQNEGQVLGGKGFMVNRTVYRHRQNKANSRRHRVGRSPRARCQSCDNASLPGVVPATNPIRWRIMRNKPNSSIADCRLPRFARNDMLRIGDRPAASGPRRRLCKTNPICHLPHRGGSAGSCKTKPIPRRGRVGRGLGTADEDVVQTKTQFPPAPGGTWPLGRGPWGHRATSPRCPASGNKANYWRSSRSDGGGIRHRMPAAPRMASEAHCSHYAARDRVQ